MISKKRAQKIRKKTQRVGILIPSYLPKLGGAQIFVHNISLELKKQNITPVVFAPNTEQSKHREMPYDVVRLPKVFFSFAKILPTAGSYIYSFIFFVISNYYKIDGWIAVMVYPSGWMLSKLTKFGGNVIVRASGIDIQIEDTIGYGLRIDKTINKKVKSLKSSKLKYVALTQTVFDEYMKIGIDKNSVAIIPNGIKPEIFHVAEKPRRKMNRAIRLLTVARYHEKKGYHLVSKIVDELNQFGVNFEWVLVGKDINKIRSQFNDDFPNNIGLIDMECEQVDTYSYLPSKSIINEYKLADVFVFLSKIETFGIVLIEAMAAGLPIVSFNAPGVSNVVNKNVSMQSEFGDFKGIAGSISRLYHEEKTYEQLSINAAKFAQEHFDISMVANAYINLMESEGQ